MRSPMGGGSGGGNALAEYGPQTQSLLQLQFGEQPEGFRTTFINDDRLTYIQDAHKRLQSGDLSLDQTVVEFGDHVLTERDVINRELNKVQSSFLLPERTVTLPGVALNRDAIMAIAAKFKDEHDLGPVVPSALAEPGQNQVVFEFATPEVYNDLANAQSGVSGVNANNFIRDNNLSAGNTVDIISDGGVAGTQGNTAYLELAREDDELIFTGDILDPLGDATLSKYEQADVDGNDDLGPEDVLFQRRLSNLHIQTVQGNYIKTRFDLDGKVYDGGDTGAAEPVPVVFRLGQADNAGALV